MRKTLPILLAATALLSACKKSDADESATMPENDPVAVMDAIHAVENGQIAALNAKDLAGATKVYTADAVLYAPGDPPASGSEAITAAFTNATADKAYGVVPDEGSQKSWVAASGDYATTSFTGQFTRTVDGAAKTDPFVNQTLWAKQQDGTWKIVSDVNAVVGTAAAAAPAAEGAGEM